MKIVTVPRKLESFDNLKSHGDVKERNGKILRRTVTQHSVLEACELKTLFSSSTFKKMSVARSVGFKE